MRIRNGVGETIQLILRTEVGTTFFRTPLSGGEVAIFTRFTRLEVKQEEDRPIEIFVRTATDFGQIGAGLAFGGDPTEITDGDPDDPKIDDGTLTLLNLTENAELRFKEGAGQERNIFFGGARFASGSQVEIQWQNGVLILLVSTVLASNP